MPTPSAPGFGQGASTFKTPLWHWALPLRKHRYVPPWCRGLVDQATHALLSRTVSLPVGLSLCPAQSWKSLRPRALREQGALWTTLANGRGQNWLTFGHALPDPWALRLHLADADQLTYWLLIQKEGRPLAFARRYMRPALGEVDHDLLAVVVAGQGGGLGAQVLANAIRVYDLIGIRKVFITAGLSAGGAVWAKFGYRPVDEREWTVVARAVRTNLAALPIEAHTTFLKEHFRSLQDAVDTVLEIPTPDAIWDLIDIDPGGRAGRAAGLSHGLAGALLQGSRWKGILDLSDPAARLRVKSYIDAKAAQGQVLLPAGW